MPERVARAPSVVGDLDAFRAFDVYQLLNMCGATGVLRLRAPGVRGEIYVEGGQIIAARARPNPRRLGRILLARGEVTAAALTSALVAQSDARRVRLGELLLARGLLTGGRLEAALVEQGEAALAALLLLPAGRFAFYAEALPAGLRRLGVDPEGLLLEAMTRLDELRGPRAGNGGAGDADGRRR